MISRRGVLVLLAAWAGVLLPAQRGARAEGLYALNSVGLGDELTTLAMSHRDPNFVMAGTANGKLYRTVDGGASWQMITITPSRTLFWGRERTPNPAMEYAPGLPGKSHHLQSWLRSKGLTTSGINLQQVLVTKGDKMVAVSWIEVDWHDENRVYVGTVDGLYRSNDKGRTFVRIFQGYTSSAERMVNTVVTDPHNPRHLYIGTASGLFTSRDRGVSFKKTMNYYMRGSYIREIWCDPQQKGLIHVAMGGSAMASPDGGKHWITTHWHEWSPRADVQSFSLGPGNLRLIGTRDGVFASWQGGEMGSWQRRGIRFVGMAMIKVKATSNPKVWLAMTHQALWVTADAGLNWSKVFHTGGKEVPRWMAIHKGDPRHLWFVTNRQIYRIGAPVLTRAAKANPRGEVSQLPSLYEFVVHVLKHNRLYFPDNQDYRKRGPWAALLPTVVLNVSSLEYLRASSSDDYMFRHWPYRYFVADPSTRLHLEVMAVWDLSRLVFDKRELPHFGRIQRNVGGARQNLIERVHRLYNEYRRLDRILTLAPPANEKVKIYHEIRLQEIAAYFDGLSGGHWSKATRREP